MSTSIPALRFACGPAPRTLLGDVVASVDGRTPAGPGADSANRTALNTLSCVGGKLMAMPAARADAVLNSEWFRIVNPLTEPSWDDWINAHPESTVFHTSAWAAVLQETYGFRPQYLVTSETDGPRGVLPLMECASSITRLRGVSLPFTDYVQPLVRGSAAFKALFDQAIALGRQRGWRAFECRCGSDCLPDAPASLTFYRHVLDLRGDEAKPLAGFDSSVRRAIRKAERSAIELHREESWEAVAAYYVLHCQTRRKHGLPPQPVGFFRSLYRHLIARGAGCVFLACHQGRPIAGALFLHRGGQALYKYGASDEAHLDLRANNLLFWVAIQFYADHGYQTLDFGRTSLGNDGLRRFKLGWGAAESRAGYLKYDLRRDRFVTDRDLASGWHNALFRRLPLPVLRWVGARLYRHLT